MIQARFTKSLTIALEQETYDKLKAITDRNYSSIAHYVRACINQGLEEENKINEMNNLPLDQHNEGRKIL